jgi:hypothetical protein
LIFALGVLAPKTGSPSSISYVMGPERPPSHVMVVRPTAPLRIDRVAGM